ncbi:hypothetical protein BKA80DRAFT_311407 [Phyllosticta citrichinensis]
MRPRQRLLRVSGDTADHLNATGAASLRHVDQISEDLLQMKKEICGLQDRVNEVGAVVNKLNESTDDIDFATNQLIVSAEFLEHQRSELARHNRRPSLDTSSLPKMKRQFNDEGLDDDQAQPPTQRRRLYH